jgi:lipooligosaccharide transport system permease protein
MSAVTLSAMLPSPSRAIHMVQRNLMVYRHIWMVIFTGFFEPVFYLLSIGIGLGAMVREVNGVSYAAFVAPGLLASSCMNGALTDGFFNTFFKLHFQKTYDGVLATPMTVPDIALGEMMWAIVRGSIYAAGFVIVMLLVGRWTGDPLLLGPSAVFAWPAAVLVATAFSAFAICLTSIARSVHDFDTVVGLIMMPMFLFAGTFFPVSSLPAPLQWLVQLLPLYHAVELLRQVTTGRVSLSILVHIAYLVALAVGTFTVAMYRLQRVLVK